MMGENPFETVLDRLSEKGWQKRGLGGDQGPNCIVGAHIHIDCFRDFISGLSDIILAQYPDRVNGSMGLVPNFNDHPDTTFTDVERVLEKAAIKWEEEKVMRDD